MARTFIVEDTNAPGDLQHLALAQRVADVATLAHPDAVHWADGSREEYDRLCEQMVTAVTLRRLNPARRPTSYLAWSDPSDVARAADRPFICSRSKLDADGLK